MKKWILLCLALPLFFSNCRKKGNGGGDSGNAVIDSFTVFPLHYADLKVLEPLGNLNPPGHTFPTSHCYLYMMDPTVQVPLLAPGNLRLVAIDRSTKKQGDSVIGQDYSLTFDLGNDYHLGFGHVTALSPELQAEMDAGTEQCGAPYGTGGTTFTQCTVRVDDSVHAGQEIGKVGGEPGQYGMDMGIYRYNQPLSKNAVCPFMFYTQAAWATIKTKFSGFFGTPRTAEPVCGEFSLDVPNTASGIWQKDGAPLYPEDPHIALVADNIKPELPVFSVGISQTGLSSGVYYYTLQDSGLVDRKFTDITADGKTYCFNIRLNNGTTVQGSILLKMPDANTIEVEYRPDCDCSCNTDYSFSDKKVGYVRPANLF